MTKPLNTDHSNSSSSRDATKRNAAGQDCVRIPGSHAISESDAGVNDDHQFREIIEAFRDAMLITSADGQLPHCRPMRIADITDAATLWFATNRYSPKVDEIVHDSQVLVTMQGAGKFASLHGRALLVENPERIQQLWREDWQTWFSGGPSDPQIILLAVLPQSGEFWDASGPATKHLLLETDRSIFSSVVELEEGTEF